MTKGGETMKTEVGSYWCSGCKRFVGRRLDEGRCPECEGAALEWVGRSG
mgnify:CR=1 FL=1